MIDDALIREARAMVVGELIAYLPDRFQLPVFSPGYEAESGRCGGACRERAQWSVESFEKARGCIALAEKS